MALPGLRRRSRTELRAALLARRPGGGHCYGWWLQSAREAGQRATPARLQLFTLLGSGVFSAIGRIFKEEGILGFFVYVSCYLNTFSHSPKAPTALLAALPTSVKEVALSSPQLKPCLTAGLSHHSHEHRLNLCL